MIHKNFTANQVGPINRRGEVMRKVVLPAIFTLSVCCSVSLQGILAEPTYPIFADVKTTRDRTVSPVGNPDAPELNIGEVEQYHAIRIQSWEVRRTASTTARVLLDGTTAAKNLPRPKRS